MIHFTLLPPPNFGQCQLTLVYMHACFCIYNWPSKMAADSISPAYNSVMLFSIPERRQYISSRQWIISCGRCWLLGYRQNSHSLWSRLFPVWRGPPCTSGSLQWQTHISIQALHRSSCRIRHGPYVGQSTWFDLVRHWSQDLRHGWREMHVPLHQWTEWISAQNDWSVVCHSWHKKRGVNHQGELGRYAPWQAVIIQKEIK